MVNFSILQPPTPRGRFNFNGNFTRDSERSQQHRPGLRRLRCWAAEQLARSSSFINDTFQQPGYFFYAQDDFKVSKRLTLNIGLRYEFISMPKERRDAEASFNIATGTLDIANGRNDPLPASFLPPDSRQSECPAAACSAGPEQLRTTRRIGVPADAKTVIRSGFGISIPPTRPAR